MNRSVARALEFLADMEEDYDLSELPALPFVLSARLMVSIYCQEFGSWGEQENRWDLPASGDDERVVVESNWASRRAARARPPRSGRGRLIFRDEGVRSDVAVGDRGASEAVAERVEASGGTVATGADVAVPRVEAPAVVGPGASSGGGVPRAPTVVDSMADLGILDDEEESEYLPSPTPGSPTRSKAKAVKAKGKAAPATRISGVRRVWVDKLGAEKKIRVEGGKASRPKESKMLLLKNWDAYARGQAPRWVGSEGALATALLFVSHYSFFPWAALMGFQSRAGKACSRCAKGSCTWVAGEDGCVQCKSKAKGCVDGEAPERWSWGSPVQDFPPSDHFGLGHLERGLRTLGFLSREADEGALGREYARLAWDLRQAWGVVRESPPFLYADGSVIARRSPVPL